MDALTTINSLGIQKIGCLDNWSKRTINIFELLQDEPERAVRVLAKIKRLKIKLNIRTYELMFTLFGTVNVPYERGNILSHMDVTKRIGAIEMDMMKNGIHHSYASMKNLVLWPVFLLSDSDNCTN